MRNKKIKSLKHKRIHTLIQVVILTAIIALLVVPSFKVTAVGQAVNVWFSSEYNPGNSGWFNNSSWENNITYKLSQQPNITVTSPGGASMTTINVYPSTKYQTIYGIGTSLEESTVYNLMQMSSTVRDICLKQLFTTQNNGINMNLARVCIGTSDFTGRTFYTYDDGAADPSLSRFSIQKDIDYNIVNVLNQAKNLNSNLKFFGSPWSPPGWMKTSGNIIGGYIDWNSTPVYATYLRKFVQAYAAQGITIDAMTIQNEPLYSPPDYPGCLMTADNEAYLVKTLRTELNNNGLSSVKLMVYDHNFDSASSFVSSIFADSAAQSATEGVAFHDYAGDPSAMTTVHNSYPSKNMYMTERTVWGVSGADRIIQYFRNWARSYNCWVTMLDSNIKPEQWSGTPGPTWLIQSASNRDTYWRLPEFYIMGQFSRYIQRNAYRINSDAGSSSTITNVAFLNPDNTVVMVAVNQTSSSQQFKVVCNGEQFIATLPAKTVGTYKWTPGSGGGATPTPTSTPTSSGGSTTVFNNFDTNQGYSAGPNATVSYNSSGQNVMLVVNVTGDPGNANQCVKVVPQSGTSVNATGKTYFAFWIDDTQGNNTHKITMVDTSNAVWSGWTSASSVKNTWLEITLPMSSVTGINKGAIKEIRIGEWNTGTYYIDGLIFRN